MTTTCRDLLRRGAALRGIGRAASDEAAAQRIERAKAVRAADERALVKVRDFVAVAREAVKAMDAKITTLEAMAERRTATTH